MSILERHSAGGRSPLLKIPIILLIAWLAMPKEAEASIVCNAHPDLCQTLRTALTDQCIPTKDEYCGEFSRATPRGTQCICPCDYQFYNERIRACEDCPFATVEGATTCGDTSCVAGSRLVAYELENTCNPGFVLTAIQRTCELTLSNPSECKPGFRMVNV